ncbi:hypothetical protein [Sandaracinus amylolyticus]|uniref:hypothetical protein n=1 Tax=Sandaracinus amylolyticus TaxID=927083 RepID=UPI001F358786|nr:hypothetical protein [Sandaracinus amylolyticus]UJR85797.1 Hypothetical protein I5071_78770 [Sandaracinus amylolyticus]
MRRFASSLLFTSIVLAACESEPPIFTAPDRAIGDRTPLSRTCDEIDATHCLMPWPSNAFTVADPSTETGLRLAVDIAQLNSRDDGSVLARADGFSRVSTLVAGFPVHVDPATTEGEVHLFAAQDATEIPLRIETYLPETNDASLVVAHPLAPLDAATDYVVVITDGLRDERGAELDQDRTMRVALALEPAHTEEEAALAGYHAPTRVVIEQAGIDPEHVLRAWDFTTRSAEDPLRRLRGMREAAIAAVDGADVEVAIDEVEHRAEGPVASVVMGRLVGLPNYLTEVGLSADDEGEPLAMGTREAPFRVVIPRGEGDYRMLMYGHGTGGSVRDANFDDAIAEAGAAKIGIEFYRWTDTTVIETFLDLAEMAQGSSAASAGLVQAVADASAIRRSASTILGDALAAEQLGGMPNPHVGRRPDDSVPIWVGGSLGGTMGLVFTASNADVSHAVLNVGGAGWATWVRDALQFGYIRGLISIANGGELNVPLVVAIAQTQLDECDGASWVDEIHGPHPIVALLQESIGDPVLPNAGSEMAARVLDATMIGEPIVPIAGLQGATTIAGASAITQYRVPGTDALDIHGFAAEDTPAAAAARAQIIGFVESAWAGEASVVVPEACEGGICDFSR